MSAISLLHDQISQYWRYIEILPNPNRDVLGAYLYTDKDILVYHTMRGTSYVELGSTQILETVRYFITYHCHEGQARFQATIICIFIVRTKIMRAHILYNAHTIIHIIK